MAPFYAQRLFDGVGNEEKRAQRVEVGKPMKMVVVDGSPVVSSIGIVGGLVDSQNETVPGDILFRLTP